MRSILLYLNEGKVKDHFKKHKDIYKIAAGSTLAAGLTSLAMYGSNPFSDVQNVFNPVQNRSNKQYVPVK